ncbi:hypothetical protein [Cohnella sp.]|uniref:hypothetical protein n=1 Tax=Cohnella sp. TaxID=1883426 RepID=UPI003561C09D
MKYWLLKLGMYSASTIAITYLKGFRWWYLVIWAIVMIFVDIAIEKKFERQREQKDRNKAKKKYPFLNELNEGQVITVELKNGEKLTDVIFLDYIKSEMLLGTETEFNNELETYEVSEIRWIKLKRVESILPRAD